MNNNISDAYAIYQLKGGDALRGLRFESYERAKDAIDKSNYQIVYSGALPEGNTLPQQLDALYRQFNIDRPPDFYGHSLSVSDVIVIRQNGVFSVHYVDSIGFCGITRLLFGKNPLRSLKSCTALAGAAMSCPVLQAAGWTMAVRECVSGKIVVRMYPCRGRQSPNASTI
jgi:hypothetical protein